MRALAALRRLGAETSRETPAAAAFSATVCQPLAGTASKTWMKGAGFGDRLGSMEKVMVLRFPDRTCAPSRILQAATLQGDQDWPRLPGTSHAASLAARLA